MLMISLLKQNAKDSESLCPVSVLVLCAAAELKGRGPAPEKCMLWPRFSPVLYL